MQIDCDYVVVGTGSAGAPVAARLSEVSSNSVVALEAGPADKDQMIHIPAGFSKLFRSKHDWDYLTTPQPELDNREIYWPRGKMLGGSSSMNAMMWVRGFEADYAEWAAAAGDAWSFDSVLSYFKKIEAVEGASGPDMGSDGPLHISRQRSPRGLTADFLEAVMTAGFSRESPNNRQPSGFTQTMVSQYGGRRFSTADGYLKPAKKRKNLTVLTEAHATRVLFEGTRAVGVEYRHKGKVKTVRARKEVVLSCGAINSPQLLMLSGVGDRAHLDSLGIPVVAHNAGIGQNLTDHLVTPMGFAAKSDTLYTAEKPLELINFLIRQRGMLSSNVGEAYGFIKSRPDLELPDIEIVFAPAPFYDEGLGVADAHGIAIGPILLRPVSRGTIRLTSKDPLAKPEIDPRYLSDPEGVDRAAMMSGLRTSYKIATTAPLSNKLGAIIRPKKPSDDLEETLADALAHCSHTLYHPTGTCRMGKDDNSVVDPQLRVRGVSGLRVADASVMPEIIRGHTHAPAVVIGEAAAEFIKAGK